MNIFKKRNLNKTLDRCEDYKPWLFLTLMCMCVSVCVCCNRKREYILSWAIDVLLYTL